MKKFTALLISIMILLVVWACTDLDHSNPFDPDWGEVTALNNVSLEVKKIDQIKVIWDSDYLNKDGYTFQIDRKIGDGTWQEKYKLFTKDTYNFIDSLAGINETNYYRVRVGYDENLSKPVEASVFNYFPSPTNINLTRIDLNTIQLRWSDNSNGEDGFIIDRYADGAWNDSLALITENIESWTDSTIVLNDSIRYRIWAYRKDVRSTAPASEWIDTKIPAPSNFTAESADITTVHISWTDNSNGEEAFKVEKKTGDGAWVDYYTAPADSTSWTDHNADLNETIQYRMYAFKGAAKSDYAVSNSVDNTFPEPTNLVLNQMDLNSVRLDWTDNSLGEDGFIIDRRNSSGVWENDHQLLSGNTEYWTDSPVDINDSLAYRIRAYKDVFAVRYFSGYSTANVNDINFPPPSNLTVTKVNLTSIRLNWTDNSAGEEGFFIDKRVNSGEWIIAAGAADADSVQWTDTAAEVNMDIQYRIYAKAGSNYSNYLVSDVIDNTIPAPSNLSYSKLDINSVRVSWTDNSSGEEGFVIDRSVNGTWTNSYATAGSNATQWTDDSAVINANLVYRVKAYYTTNYSNTVETGIINNTFPAPANLTAQINGMQITLNWTDNSAGETGFIIDRKYNGDPWDDNYRTITADSILWTETVADTGKYYYRIKAYYGADQSATTAVAEAWAQQTLNEMILVPAGTFMMGQVGVAEPVHEVTITHSYYMAKYETTQKEWTDIMGTNPAHDYGVGDNYPVYYVSWYDILVYCNKRSIEEGLNPCYVLNNSTDPNDWGTVPTIQDATWDAVECRWYVNGYRLPTEAEWEYAARYNDGRTYPWGEAAPNYSLCNYNSYYGGTNEIGNYISGNSNLGFSDMAGNIYELVWDWLQLEYPDQTLIDPTGPHTGTKRCARGGWWYNDDVTTTFKHNVAPYYRGDFYGAFGFRVARNISTLQIPAPSNLSAEVSGMNITLNWTDNSNGEHGFKIDKKIGDDSWAEDYAQVGSEIVTWSETVADTGKYYYRLKAFIDNDESMVSNEVELFVQINLSEIEMILVPAGSFQMGGTFTNNTPVHTVNLSRSYYLSKYELTQKHWQEIMGSIPSQSVGSGDNYPVYYISWYDILVYCNKRSISEGFDPCYEINSSINPGDWGSVPASSSPTWDAAVCYWNNNGYRMPSEAEWERAAKYDDNRTYPWGENNTSFYSRANCNDYVGITTEVGNYSPLGDSQLGFCDMGGNVWEITWDWWSTYSSSTLTDPTGPSSGTDRVFRGGAYSYDTESTRCAVRTQGWQPSYRANWVGFRIARTAE